MTDFPVVQYLDASTFSETQEDPAISAAKMEGGYVLSRPRFTRRPRRTFTFNFDGMTDADKTTLQTFWNTVHGSSDMFNWTHPQTGEVILVRFDSAMGNLKIDVSVAAPATMGSHWKSGSIILTEV